MILFRDGVEVQRGPRIAVTECFGCAQKASYVLVCLDGGEASFDIDIACEGADVSLKGLYVLSGEDDLSIKVNLKHSAGGSVSNQVFRGVMDGRSKALFDGRIVVAPDAQGTEAYQNCRNILLSEEAVAQSLPQLEIYADDVKCSHGATCGSLDEDEQFYMRSRGITLEEARRLQIISFLSPVLSEIPEEICRSVIQTLR